MYPWKFILLTEVKRGALLNKVKATRELNYNVVYSDMLAITDSIWLDKQLEPDSKKIGMDYVKWAVQSEGLATKWLRDVINPDITFMGLDMWKG